MKKKVLFILLLILALSMTLLFTGCGGSDTSDNSADEAVEATEEAAEETEEAETETTEPAVTTLEEYFNANEGLRSTLGYDEDSNCEISVSGNQYIQTYDYSKKENASEEQVRSDTYVEALETSLEQLKESQGMAAKNLELASGISGIETVVIHCWGDDVLASMTYTSADAPE